MADSTTEIDLDSVIDRLLEGATEHILFFVFLVVPGAFPATSSGAYCSSLPPEPCRFSFCLRAECAGDAVEGLPARCCRDVEPLS